MSKLREILEKYAVKSGFGVFIIMVDDFDKLEEELQEYIDKNYRKIYGSHDVEEFYKE